MAGDPMVVELVTPESPLVDEPAEAIMLRSSDGELTILPGHTPLVTDVVPGLVRIETEDGNVARFAVHGGFLQVEPGADEDEEGAQAVRTRVRMLAGIAERADEIDVERARRAREAAEARIEELRSAGVQLPGEGDERRTETDGAEPRPVTEEEVALEEAQAAAARATLRIDVVEGGDGVGA